jgi:hypothetical protein
VINFSAIATFKFLQLLIEIPGGMNSEYLKKILLHLIKMIYSKIRDLYRKAKDKI